MAGQQVQRCRSTPREAAGQRRFALPAFRNSIVCQPQRRPRSPVALDAAPAWNPQNVPDPVAMPSPELSPQGAVARQLDAMKCNDEPWMNHGLQTMYEFAEDAGGMERSYYFGFSKDLYHFDHFMGMFQTKLGGLVNLSSYSFRDDAPQSRLPGGVAVEADVIPAAGGAPQRYRFVLVQRELGRKKGCWMTKQLVLVEATEAAS